MAENSDPSGPSNSFPNAMAATNCRARWDSRGSGLECEVVVISKPTPIYSIYNPVSRAVVILIVAAIDRRSFRISCTIIAPTPLVAANFVILGMIINKLGDHYSRLSTKWCKWIDLFLKAF